jgi:hypothetical protein
MIIDSLENASKYSSVHPLFAKAFEYVSQTDLASIEVGKYDISEGLKAIVSDKKGMRKNPARSLNAIIRTSISRSAYADMKHWVGNLGHPANRKGNPIMLKRMFNSIPIRRTCSFS